ncbi:MAG: class II fructose-bisphosphate aldolase [Lachnospiraceae bacterium]|nr:class II fructose-bisphosphate aldolase [Lachnospiraceae bacterium]
MLVNLNEVLQPARANKYAVGLFNTVNFEMARGVLAAAEAQRSPVIIGTAEILLPFGPLEELAEFLIPMAKKASVPVVVHFDHGLSFEKCMEALKFGFTSIMYDCSTDTYEENIRKVKELVQIAHCFGATVEGELGHVGDNEGSAEGNSILNDPSIFYTDPAQAKDYLARTNTDALAIAVGTAHGAYKMKPKLDFKRIAAIRDLVDVPLVLHGGSGLSDEDFKHAIKDGISKINIFTDINVAAAQAAKKALNDGKNSMTDIIPYQITAIQSATEAKMRLFDSNNK